MADWEVPRLAGKLKNEDKVRILSWKDDGMSTAEIAKRLGRYKASIDHLWAKSKGLPKFVIPQRKMGSGRPKKMTKVMKKMLKRQAVKFLQMTSADLQNSVPELRIVSERTIQRTLQRPEDAVLHCCPEASSHHEDESQEAQSCQGLQALDF
jgi:IS30 family transposase